MTTEDDEIEQVRIRRWGQCPKHKGHAVSNYWLIFLVTAYFGFIAGGFLVSLFTPDREGEAIELGYAQHNPVSGKWEWIKR